MRRIPVTFIVACLCILIAWSQEEGQLSEPVDGQIPVATFTCSEHIKMTGLQDGRSDVRIVWAHGYYSALRGVDENSPPIDIAELVTFSQRLDKACRAEPNKLFLVAVKEMSESTGP
jgi:hypothetical protein